LQGHPNVTHGDYLKRLISHQNGFFYFLFKFRFICLECVSHTPDNDDRSIVGLVKDGCLYYFMFFFVLLEIPSLPDHLKYRIKNSVKKKLPKTDIPMLEEQCEYCKKEEEIQKKIKEKENKQEVIIKEKLVKFLFINEIYIYLFYFFFFLFRFNITSRTVAAQGGSYGFFDPYSPCVNIFYYQPQFLIKRVYLLLIFLFFYSNLFFFTGEISPYQRQNIKK
jgi:hypothetical protein